LLTSLEMRPEKIGKGSVLIKGGKNRLRKSFEPGEEALVPEKLLDKANHLGNNAPKVKLRYLNKS
jgi:hypothetical protein